MKLYRFELAFDGEPQGVGFLQGLDEIGLMTDEEIPVLQMFEPLPCPHIDKSCEFWFTETGLAVFAPALVSAMQTIHPYRWSLLVATTEAESLDGSLYSDKYQVAWPKEQFHAEYREVSSIELFAAREKVIAHTKKNGLTILIDMDDVLEDLLGTWVEVLNEKYGTTSSAEDVTDWWHIEKAFPTLTKEEVYAPIYENWFWTRVKPKPGAAETVKRLMDDGHDIYVLTASDYEVLQTKMDDILFKYFPFLSFRNVIVTKAPKSLIRGDVLIDDAVHNLVGGEYEKILFSMPTNAEYDAEGHGMYRASNWEEIYEIIGKIAEER